MIFRKAEFSEKEIIMSLYRSAAKGPFCTWNEYYPDEVNLNDDLAAGSLYVLEDDSMIVGAVSVVPVNEMDDFDCWSYEGPAAEIARVVIRPDMQGRGLSSVLVSAVLAELEKRAIKTVRLSAAKINIPANRLYRSLGFQTACEKQMYGSSYNLMEKVL